MWKPKSAGAFLTKLLIVGSGFGLLINVIVTREDFTYRFYITWGFSVGVVATICILDAYNTLQKHFMADTKEPERYKTESEKEKKNLNQSLNTKELTTLLIIIAALCKELEKPHAEKGAAGYIQKLTEDIGAPVTDDTIRKYLTQIPDALERRMK